MSQRPRGPREERPGRGPRRTAPSPSHLARQMGELAGYGVTMGLATALFAWLGSRVDASLGTQPLFVLIGAFVGFGAGFYSMYRRLVSSGSDVRGGEEGGHGGPTDRD